MAKQGPLYPPPEIKGWFDRHRKSWKGASFSKPCSQSCFCRVGAWARLSLVAIPRGDGREQRWGKLEFVFCDWGQRMPPFSLAANGGCSTCCWTKDLGGQPAVGAGGTGLKLCILVPICPKEGPEMAKASCRRTCQVDSEVCLLSVLAEPVSGWSQDCSWHSSG